MSKDKMDPGAKKIVREKTERIKRSDARRQKPDKPGDSGTCSRICGATWRTTRIQKGMSMARWSPESFLLCNPPPCRAFLRAW